jgi:MinD superfamily P-loop ATPase
MRIAIASGKGGTGKTTIATSLAVTLAEQNIRLLDCDVEAPDAALYLKPRLANRKQVGILVPVVDKECCTYCGKCAEVCQFHAIAVFGKRTLVFPELCHGCGKRSHPAGYRFFTRQAEHWRTDGGAGHSGIEKMATSLIGGG